MKSKFAHFPNWYKVLLFAAYILPFPVIVVSTIFVLLKQGFLTLIASFVGALLVAAMAFFPFVCIYYAALTLIQAFVDEMFFCSKRHILNIFIAAVCSIFWASSSVLTLKNIEHEYGWIYLILMFLGLFMTGAFFVIRLCFMAFCRKNHEY